VSEQEGKVGTLSRQFADLMGRAGLVEKKKHRKIDGKAGRVGRREGSALSFHSFRHTTTSMLKNAGVSSAIAEEFVGHNSAEMNRIYTHIGDDALRRAADALPDVA
jgi:integrase